MTSDPTVQPADLDPDDTEGAETAETGDGPRTERERSSTEDRPPQRT